MNSHTLASTVAALRVRGVQVAHPEAGFGNECCALEFQRFISLLGTPGWLRAIAADDRIRQAAQTCVNQLPDYFNAASSKTEVGMIARVARRHLVLQERITRMGGTVETHLQAAEFTLQLPSPTGLLDRRDVRLSEKTVTAVSRMIALFAEGSPLTERTRGERREDLDPWEKFEDAKPARSAHGRIIRWSVVDQFRPVCCASLSGHLHVKLSRKNPHRLMPAFAALAKLSIYYAIDYRDLLDCEIGGPPSQSAPGWIDLERRVFVKEIGGTYYGNTGFQLSLLELPLLPCLVNDLAKAGLVQKGKSIAQQLPAGVHSDHRDYLRKEIAVQCGPIPSRSVAIHRSFDAAALLECGVSAAELSLIRGYPVYGSGTECAYISRTSSELRTLWLKTVRKLEQWAGIPATDEISSKQFSEHTHGTVCRSSRELFDAIIDQTRAAGTVAECRAALVAILGGIGFRNRNQIENPAHCARSFPASCLQIVDKWANDRAIGVRYLPLTNATRELVRIGRDFFGDEPFLPAETSLKRDQKTKTSTHQEGRTAFYNAITRQNRDPFATGALSGHDTAASWESTFLPLSNLDLFDRCTAVFEQFEKDSGLGDAVDALRRSLDGIARKPNFSESAKSHTNGAPPHRELTFDARSRTFQPLTALESSIGSDLIHAVHFGPPLPKTGAGLLVALALELGTPIRQLVEASHYLTLRNVIQDPISEDWFFLVPLFGNDLGGLEFYPIKFPRKSQSLRLIFDRRDRVQRTHPQMAGRSALLNFSLLTGTTDSIHRGICRIVATRLRTEQRRIRIFPEFALTLTQRLSVALCRWRQPGPVAAALAELIPDGLNQMDLRAAIGVSQLQYLDGSDYDQFPFQKRRSIKPISDRAFQLKRYPFVFDAANRTTAQVEDQIFNWVVEKRITPGYSRFYDLTLSIMHRSGPAQALAERLMSRCRPAGLLEPSAPEYCPTDETVFHAISEIFRGNIDVRPAGVSLEERRRLADFVGSRLLAIIVGGLRVSETLIALIDNRNPAFMTMYVRRGKTKAAKRIIFVSTSEFPELIGAPFFAMARRGSQFASKATSQTQQIRRQLRRLLPLAKPHSLRRWRAIGQLNQIAESHPNPIHGLATMIRSFGHAWGHTLMCRYVGAFLYRYSSTPTTIEGDPEIRSLEQSCLRNGEKPGLDRLRRLHKLYSGELAATASLQSEVTRIENAPIDRLGRPDDVHLSTSSEDLASDPIFLDPVAHHVLIPSPLPEKDIVEAIVQIHRAASQKRLRVVIRFESPPDPRQVAKIRSAVARSRYRPR